MSCFSLANSIPACGESRAMGVAPDAYWVSKADVTAITRDAAGTITAITLASGKKYSKISGINTSFRPKASKIGNEYGSLYKHEATAIIFAERADSIQALNNLNEDIGYLIYLDNKGAYRMLGTESTASGTELGPGVNVLGMEYDPYNTDTSGGLLFTFTTSDKSPCTTMIPYVNLTGGTATVIAAALNTDI